MAANVWTVDSHFLNVGGGESAIHLLLLNGVVDRAVLIDGGLDTGANAIRVAVDMIKRRYNKLELKFNTVVVTHWDRDHVNGVRKLLITSHAQFIDDTTFFFCAREGQFTTAKKMCVSGAAAPQMLQVNGTNVCRAVTGPDCIGYDLFDNTRVAAIGVTLVQAAALNAQRPVFLVVGAENHFIDGTVGDLPNMNGSSVMAVIVWPAVFGQRNRVSLYTGGDAEEEQEERLLTWLGSRVTARLDATKAGHHGSHFSTKEALLDFDNRAFVISAGKSSGHPSFSVLFFVLALAHARPDGNQLHVLATRVPYWLGKEPGDIGPVDINLSFVADYGDGPIAYSDELDRMTGGTPVVTWLAEAIRTNKTFLAHQKDDIPDLDELIPRPIPARVDGWALPTAGVTDKERDAYYHDAQLQARAVVLQQWRILGQPREGDTEFGDTILVSQNATGIECTPIRLAVPAVVALMTDMIDGADVGVIMGTATDLAAPSTTASKTKASGKLKAGAKHKAPPVAATKYIKPAREADKHGKVVKKFFPNPGKNKSLAAGEAAGRADDLEEWTLGAFVFPDRLPQSHRWLALCLGGEASVTADIGPIAPEIAITAGGLRFTTAAAARVAQFGAGVQPQGALGYDERFSGVLLAVEPAACGTVTLAGLARLLHFPLPEWLAAAVGPIPLSPLATAEARSGIWYAPATANNLTVVRLAMQPDPASDALARLTDLLATGLGSLKVTNAVVRGTCTHELSLVPGDNQIFRQASLGLELDIAWDSGAAGAQGGARPAFASRVALMFTEAGFALDIRLAKDSNILQSLVSWAQGGLHTADTMPDAGGVVDDLRGQLQALSEHIYLHNLSLSFDSASKRFTSFGIALEVAMPVGEGNAPFIAAFRWTHGVYTLSAELWHRRTYGDLPKELYPYWESITEVQPWAERPVPYISIEELIGQDITIPNGFPDTITSAGLSLSFGAGTAELSLHGTVVCADEPGMDAGEIPCLKFEELSLGLTLSASEVTVQLRGVVSADCPPHLLTPRAMRADNKILLHTAIAYSRQDGSNNWDIFASVHNVRLGNLYSFFAKDGTNLVIMDFLSNITIVEAHAEYEYVTSEPSFLKLGGTLRLGKDDSHVELAFDYSHVRGKSWTFDASLINNIKAGAKPITLGDLIHEVVDDISFLPESVQSFSLPVSKVTKVLLSLKSGKDSKVDFSLGIDIGHLKLRLTYNVIVESGEIKGKVGKFSIWMSGGSDEYSVGAFLKFASEKVGKALQIPYPESFGPLDKTVIYEFSIQIGKEGAEGKYSVKDVIIKAKSDLKLQLWDKPLLSLDKVTLLASYSPKAGFGFQFGADLKIDQHTLTTTIGYDKVPGAVAVGNAAPEKYWFIQAQYDAAIDLLAVAKKLAGANLASELAGTQLPKLSTQPAEGIVITNLTLTLQKFKAGGAIYVAADTTWSVFTRVEFAATYEGAGAWGVCLNLSLKDKLLSLIPVQFVQEFGDKLEVNNTFVALYVGKVNARKAGLTSKQLPPVPGSDGFAPAGGQLKFGVAVSTKLKITDKFGALQKWIGAGTELDVTGEVSSDGFGLGVGIGKINLLKNAATGKYDLVIDGRIDVKAGAAYGVQLGLLANMTIRAPDVSADIIQVKHAGFVVNSAGAVGFQGAVDGKLRNLFGVAGLEARGLSVKGLFSLAEWGLPEELGLTGEIGLADMGGIKGRIELYFAQHNIASSYFAAKLENVNMQDICNYHLKQQGLPKAAAAFLEGNVVLNVLEIEAALQDMHVHQLDRDVQAGFFYEGSIYIELDGVKWSGYMCIEVRLGAFQFIGMMSPLSWAPENKTFFSLARSSLVAADYGVPAPKGVVDEDMRLNGPVVFISTKHKAMPLFVSAHLVLLGLDFQVQAVGKPSGFWADLACTFKVTMFGLVDTTASLAGSACVMPANKKESASFSLDIGLALDLPLPNYLAQCVGKVVSVFSASAPPVGVHVSVHFAVAIGPGGANFTFVLAGKLYACGLLFTLPAIEEGLRRDEMDTPDMVIAQIVGQFMSGFPKWLPEALGTDVDKITAFATEQLTFGGTDLVTTVSHFSGKGPAEIIETLGKDKLALHSSADAVAMLQDFGTPAGPAMTIAKRMFGDDEPAPAPAVESKQLTLLEKITLVLWKVKAVGLADGGTQSVQDEGPGQAQNVQNMTLITAALRVYPMGEVIEAANEMFGDLPPELLDAYFEIAQEIIADEQAALALEENATERENTAMRADDAAGLEAKSSVDTVVAVVKIV